MTLFRFSRILILAFSLVALIWYGHSRYPAITLQMCLADPDRYDGTTIVVGNEATVSQNVEDGFYIRQMGREVKVITESSFDIGEFIILQAVFHKPNLLFAEKIRIAKKRRWKIWLSVIPAIAVCAFFIKRYRFNTRNFYFEERA